MDKVAELLATIPYVEKLNATTTEIRLARDELIRDKLESGELSFDDVVNYNERDNKTRILFCTTCDNVSEVDKPTHYVNHAVCYECESFFW